MQNSIKNNKNKKNLNNTNKNKKKNNKKKRMRLFTLYSKGGYLRQGTYLPWKLRNLKDFNLAAEIAQEFQWRAQVEYLFGLLHPDKAYEAGSIVKLPSTLPIPTNTFGWQQTHKLNSNQLGNLNLFWAPNFYITDPDASLIQDLALREGLTVNADFRLATTASVYYNNHSTLTGNEPNNHFRPFLQEYHEVAVSKYRLVSALLRIRYIGKTINTSGAVVACATYNDTSRLIFAAKDDNTMSLFPTGENIVNESIQKFGNNNLIRKGQWARSLTKERLSDGIEFLYLPTDVLNTVFSNSGSIGNKSIFKRADIDNISTEFFHSPYERAEIIFTPENANLQYAIGIYGITPNEPIQIDEYRIYETIPTEENMSMFRQNTPLFQLDLSFLPSSDAPLINSETSIRPSSESVPKDKLKQSIAKKLVNTAKKVYSKPIVKKTVDNLINTLSTSLMSNLIP